MTPNIEDAPVTALVGGGWVGVGGWHFTEISHTHYGSSLCLFHSGSPGCAQPTVVSFIYLAMPPQTALALRLI